MKYNKLSHTDIKVSEICLGTMTFGEQNTEAEGHKQLDYALENGVNFIDTAEMYAVPSTEDNTGKTEDIIGTWIKKRNNRKDFILATKVTGPSPNLKYISDNLGFSKERVHEALEKSLRKLNTDYIDLYQLHWPERNTNFFGKLGYSHKENERWKYNLNEVVETMSDLVDSGKIRHWGISNETPWGVMKYLYEADLQKKHRPVSIQNPYSLLNRSYEVGMAEISMREDIGLLTYSPMGFGRLSGKFLLGKDKPQDRINQFSQMSRYNGDRSIEATKKYYEIAQKYNVSLAQMSLAWVHSRPFNTSTIIGATDMDQLKENIASTDLILTKEMVDDINGVHAAISNPAP